MSKDSEINNLNTDNLPARKEQTIASIKGILDFLGEESSREGLAKTPERHLKSLEYLTSGYHQDIEKIITSALFHENYSEMVIVRDIEIYSLCEHHMLPFYGRCHVGYIPNGKIIGLSKIPRLVDAFARRLQVQERLTDQVSDALQKYLEPNGVGVVIEAFHMCMIMRGVKKQNSFTITSSLRGSFQQSETRAEFMSLIRAPKPVL